MHDPIAYTYEGREENIMDTTAQTALSISAAHKDHSAKGRRRAHWFRMAWHNGGWEYLGDRRLANGTFYSGDRHDTVYGDVWDGELVAQHDRGGAVDTVYIVSAAAEEERLQRLAFARRSGRLLVTLPDGEELDLPDPRS
jgi:hypothetical protein